MSKVQKSFVAGAVWLGLAGLIVKVIGMLFRIPLFNIVGSTGMANYQVAYPVYSTLLVISTAGLPAAISRMVSERVSVGDYRSAHKVFQLAFRVLLVIGIVSSIVMLLVAGSVANRVGIPTAKLSLMMIAPALFFVSILSAYRGYFQGLQMMAPTAVTQLIEQAVKLGAGLYLASLWVGKGVEYGAAGALLGVSLSEVCALALIAGMYHRKKRDIQEKRGMLSNAPYKAARSISIELLVIALPITLGGCVMPLIGLLDTAIITNTLVSIGYTSEAAQASFGVFTGAVNTLVNMPAVLSLALCISLVPAISEARAQKDSRSVSARSAMGFKLAVLIGFPCALGMYLLSEPILKLLYSSSLTAAELTLATALLKTASVSVLFLTMLQVMTGILQGAGRQFIPLASLAIGAAVKVILSLALIRVPAINIQGAAISTLACYGIAAIIDIIAVIKYTKADIRLKTGLLMPLISSGIMGFTVHFLYSRLSASMDNTASTLVTVAAAAIVYVFMLFISGSLRREDMEFIPGGGRVTILMNKLNFWRE